MRLLRFLRDDGITCTGILTERGIIDLQCAAEIFYDFDLPLTIQDILANASAQLDTLGAFTEAALDVADKMAALGEMDSPEWLLQADNVQFLPPIDTPHKIIGVGKNYADHAAELGGPPPDEYPMLFSKFSNALAAHGDTIPSPSYLQKLDYEAELAVIIGRAARDVFEDDALDYVFGYCNGNDISERALQNRTSQWLLGKTLDKSLPLGPFILTADAVPDPQALDIRCWVNGELRQNASTRDMTFSVARLISYMSQYMTLLPGDIIMTGTPAGVAAGMPNQPWLKTGDEIVVEITHLGRLSNRMGGTARLSGV